MATGQKKAMALASVFALIASSALGRWDEWDARAEQDPALILTRALVAEAGYRIRVDHAAILHVLRRRTWQKDPVGDAYMAIRYCSVFKRETRRAIKLRAAPWEYFERRAPQVTSLVQKWVRGDRVGDPCRGKARHWGSIQDMERLDLRGRVLADCGPTANVFLRR